MTVRARVFSKDGNRFLIPGYWCDAGDENWQGMSEASIIVESMMLSVVANLDTSAEWLSIEPGKNGKIALRHVPYELIGPQFAHGGIKVLLISGPLYDAAWPRPPLAHEVAQ